MDGAQQSVLMNQMSEEKLAQTVVDLIKKNGEVRQAVINLVCSCPNIVTEI